MVRYLPVTVLLLFFGVHLHAQEVTATAIRPTLSSAVVTSIVRENPVTIFPAANFTQQLQGRVSGIFSTSANGRPGSPVISAIRGQSSVNGDSEPYYIVNGIPFTTTQLATINIQDIESVTILKDAIVTAQYGINGGNGVVLVETKKGRKQPLSVNVSTEAGFSNILKNKLGLMDTQQKLSYEKELGIIDQATYDARLLHNSNPIGELFRTAWLQRYDLQLSGGNDHATYYLSGGYYTQHGIHHRSDYSRYTINANINIDASKWLRTGMFLYVGKERNSYPPTTESGENYVNTRSNLTLAALRINPYEQLKNLDGSYNKNLISSPNNPLYDASLFNDELNNTNISGTGFFEIKLIRELNLRSSIVLKQYEAEEYVDKRSDSSYFYSEHSDHKSTSVVQNNKLSFNVDIDSNQRHKITTSLSQEYRITNGSLNESSSEPYSGGYSYSHNFIKDSKGKILSGILELRYSYKDRLIFDAAYRIDRLDLFSMPKKSTAKSWATAAKWVVFDETYSILSRVALRGSTGRVAHLPLAFTHLSYTNPLAYSSSNITLYTGSTPCETTQTHNLGIDAYLGGYTLRLYADLYYKNTSDVFIPLAPTTPIARNTRAEVENKGIEIALDWSILNRWKYFLELNANLTLNQNRLKSLPEGEIHNGIQVLKEGKPLGSYYLARWAGVNPNTGEAMWYDDMGNKTTSYNNAKQEYIDGKSSIPSKSAGFSISGGYKGFSLASYFYGIWDVYTYNQNLAYVEMSNINYAESRNLTASVASYWKNQGAITAIPKPYTGNENSPDTRFLQNHSYFRLKSLTLAYDFERKTLSRTKVIAACRIFVTAHNLLTITGYKGFTPEVLGYKDYAIYPESKTFSWGIKLTFR
jgi:TonB-linked SusC/RagA family outer membrane protein